MRVALLSRNARPADAIGQQVMAKLHYFTQRGAEVRLYLSEGASPSAIVGNAAKVWKTEQDYLRSADLVIAEFGGAYDLMHLLPALAGQGPRIIVDYHGITPHHLVEPSQREEVEAACRQRPILWCADQVMVHSDFAKRELFTAIGLPAERVQVIPCYVDRRAPCRQADVDEGETPVASDAHHRAALRRYPNLSNQRIILFVGRFARNKHPEQLIEALPSLPGDVHAVFIGPQGDVYREHVDSCRASAASLGVADRVHFLGTVPDDELARWYDAAEVFVLPSEHECFGMPVVEAMARGTPVIIAPHGALPELVGHAGLQASELAIALRRLLSPLALPGRGVGGEGASSDCTVKRVALVAHRFGTQFAGGAERSLRLMATALQSQGYAVEVFTTCNTHESQWRNTLPPGTTHEDGFTVHRFPIDAFDAGKLGEAYLQIQQNGGRVSADVEHTYLQHSLGSTALIDALEQRRSEFAAILTGPYLFKLIHEVAQRFNEQVLLAPCFHDEPLAKLQIFQQTYRQVGGLVFHSEPEAKLTAELLGISQPRHAIVGTLLPAEAQHGNAANAQAKVGSPYLVYCGRYCPEKGLDRLLHWFEQYSLAPGQWPGAGPRESKASSTEPSNDANLCAMSQTTNASSPPTVPGQARDPAPGLNGRGLRAHSLGSSSHVPVPVKLVCLGQGPMKLPSKPWLIDAGFVSEQEKRDYLAGAMALVNLSRNESLSIVALEAWAVKTPVIVDAQCPVLVDQVRRSNGGWVVKDAAEFASAVQSIHSRSESGHRYVRDHYLDPNIFGQKLASVVHSLAVPLRDIMRQRGLEQAAAFTPLHWEERFAELVERVEQVEASAPEPCIVIEPLQLTLNASPQMTSLPLSLRLKNEGTTLLAAEGPAAASLHVQILDDQGVAATSREEIALTKPLPPGKTELIVAALSLPPMQGAYTLKVQLRAGEHRIASIRVPIVVAERQTTLATGGASVDHLHQQLQPLLAEASRQQALPTDYVDVTEGSLAPLKKAVKTKLLHNLRKAFLEPAFRQQSALNEKLLQAICLLAEGQAAQDVAATQAQLLRQMRQLERQLKRERRARRRLERQIAQWHGQETGHSTSP